MLKCCINVFYLFYTFNFLVFFYGKFFRNKLYKEIVFCFVNNYVWDYLVYVFVVNDGYKVGSWRVIGKLGMF